MRRRLPSSVDRRPRDPTCLGEHLETQPAVTDFGKQAAGRRDNPRIDVAITGPAERSFWFAIARAAVSLWVSHRLPRCAVAKVADDSWAVRHEYRLTDKGADLYHVPLAILTWGQRWLGAAESDTTLTHTPCGADLKVVLSCGVCAEPMTRDTIALADVQLGR
jgi:hypothetical protein